VRGGPSFLQLCALTRRLRRLSLPTTAKSLRRRGETARSSRGDRRFPPLGESDGDGKGDGCLYITNRYNRIISHNEVARDHPARDKAHGRVWRVRHRSQPERSIPDLTKVADSQLLEHLRAANTSEMDAAWRQIGLRKPVSLAPQPAARSQDSGLSPPVRREAVRALATLRVPEREAFEQVQPLTG
jgi:hypothetical protein